MSHSPPHYTGLWWNGLYPSGWATIYVLNYSYVSTNIWYWGWRPLSLYFYPAWAFRGFLHVSLFFFWRRLSEVSRATGQVALWLLRWQPKTFMKKLTWRLFWNKKGWGPQSHFSYESHDEPFSDALRRLDSSMLLLMQPRQPSRRGFPHWKMWETNSGFWQISQVLQMRSWQSNAMH